jgi:hypothetical protein
MAGRWQSRRLEGGYSASSVSTRHGSRRDAVDDLLANLHSLRTSVLGQLSRLNEMDARRSRVPSGTNLAGLIRHLTFVEVVGVNGPGVSGESGCPYWSARDGSLQTRVLGVPLGSCQQ